MVEILKSNWFVVLIAIIILSFVVYFVLDLTKYNVSGKTVDGQELLASSAGKNITADEFYEEEQKFDSSLLYTMYKDEVVNQTIETTDDLKSDAKDLETTIETNFKSNYGDDYETTMYEQLANYGYTGENGLYNYCLTSYKEKELYADYIEENFDNLKEAVEAKSPRTISIIKIAVEDPDNLTDDEKQKKEDVDSEIESESFAKAATEFSVDTNTASNKGFYGYIDTDDESNASYSSGSSTSSDLDSTIIAAAMNLKKGETSDWISVTDSTGYGFLYKVHVDQTSLKKMFNSKNDDVRDAVISSFVSNNNNLQYDAIEEAASKLEIKFNDEDTETKIKDYVDSLKTTDEEESE